MTPLELEQLGDEIASLSDQLTRAYSRRIVHYVGVGADAAALADARQSFRLAPTVEQIRKNLYCILAKMAGDAFGRAEFAVAATLFEEALEVAPNRAEVHYNLSAAYMRLSLAKAMDNAFAAWAMEPTNAYYYRRGMMALGWLCNEDDAERFAAYRRAYLADPGYVNAIAHARAVLPDAVAAEAALTHAISLKPDWPFARNFLGVVLANSGRIEEAARCFERALPLHPGTRERLWRLDRAFFQELAGWVPRHRQEPSWVARSQPAKGDLVVITACDSIYFDKYGGHFIEELSRQSAVFLHIHIADADDAQIAAAVTALNGALAGRFSLTVGRTATADIRPEVLATYYACLRFYVTERLLDVYGPLIFVTDIDIESLDGGLAEWAASFGDFDVATLVQPTQFPNEHYAIGRLLIHINDRTRRFLWMMMAFNDYCFANGTASWWMDQSTFYCVERFLNGDGLNLRVVTTTDRPEVFRPRYASTDNPLLDSVRGI